MVKSPHMTPSQPLHLSSNHLVPSDPWDLLLHRGPKGSPTGLSKALGAQTNHLGPSN